MATADAALYRAKREGRNRVVVSMGEPARQAVPTGSGPAPLH